MTKNPFLNAVAASAYIMLVVTIMNRGKEWIPEGAPEYLMGIAMLSLFVFSASVMGYLFLAAPIQLFLSGEKERAVKLFVGTMLTFGGITALIFVTLLSGVFA